MERAIFNTSKAAQSAAKDWTDMMYREEMCIRDTVNCPTQAHSWPVRRILFTTNEVDEVNRQEWNAMVEWYEPSAETGRPQFHRDFLTTADIERLNEYLKTRLDQMKKDLA